MATGWPVRPSMTVPLAVIVLGLKARNNAAATAAVTTSASGRIRAGRRHHARRAAIDGEGGAPGWRGGPVICDMTTIPRDNCPTAGQWRPGVPWERACQAAIAPPLTRD
jgi:hypothetical protein